MEKFGKKSQRRRCIAIIFDDWNKKKEKLHM